MAKKGPELDPRLAKYLLLQEMQNQLTDFLSRMVQLDPAFTLGAVAQADTWLRWRIDRDLSERWAQEKAAKEAPHA